MSIDERIESAKKKVDGLRAELSKLEDFIKGVEGGRKEVPPTFGTKEAYLAELSRHKAKALEDVNKAEQEVKDCEAQRVEEQRRGKEGDRILSELLKALKDADVPAKLEGSQVTVPDPSTKYELCKLSMSFEHYRSGSCSFYRSSRVQETRILLSGYYKQLAAYKVREDGTFNSDKIIKKIKELYDSAVCKKESEEQAADSHKKFVARVKEAVNKAPFKVTTEKVWSNFGGRRGRGHEIDKVEGTNGNGVIFDVNSCNKELLSLNLRVRVADKDVEKLLSFVNELSVKEG